jgi:hypothetical protein
VDDIAERDSPAASKDRPSADAATSKERPTALAATLKGAPTTQYLEAIWPELEDLYREQDKQIDEMRSLRELRTKVNIPSDYKLVDIEIRDATITDEVMRLVAMLTVNQPSLTVNPRPRRGDRAERNATLREQWTEEMLRQAGPNVFEETMDAVCGDGGAWTKFLFNKDLWAKRYGLRLNKYLDEDAKRIDDGEDLEEQDSAETRWEQDTEQAKKEAGVPFRWVSVDSRTVYPMFHNGQITEVLEIQSRPLSQVFRQFRLGWRNSSDGPEIVEEELAEPISPSEKQTNSHQRCDVWEHWERQWVTYAVKHNGSLKIVKQWRHGYGRVPYFQALGYRMNYWRNRKVGWGVSFSKRWLVEYRAFLWTLHAQVAARDARPLLFSELSDAAQAIVGDDGRPRQAEQWTPGTVRQGMPGEKLQPVNMPMIGNSLREQISLVSEQIQNLESPRVKGPLGGGMEGAGFAISQLLTEAKTKDQPLVTHVQDMYNDVTGFAWNLVKNKIKEKVWVYREGEGEGWLGVGPDDLKDTVGYNWKIDPERPSAKMVESRYWHERLQAGTTGWSEAVSAMGDNPDEIRLSQAEDKIRNGEWYQGLLQKEVAEIAGRGDAIADAQAQAAAESGMPPGMEGAAPQMGAPGDPAALAMAPGGAGAAPQSPVAAGIAPPNGNVGGVGPGTVMPMQAATASVQNLGT